MRKAVKSDVVKSDVVKSDVVTIPKLIFFAVSERDYIQTILNVNNGFT